MTSRLFVGRGQDIASGSGCFPACAKPGAKTFDLKMPNGAVEDDLATFNKEAPDPARTAPKLTQPPPPTRTIKATSKAQFGYG
jgi:hypothetical protein